MKHLTAILILFLPLALQASEIRTGVLFHDAGEIWGNTRKEIGADLNYEVIFGEGFFRPNLGVSFSFRGYTSKIYAGCVMEPQIGPVFVSLAFGGALHNGEIHSREVKSLGSRVLFRVAAEVGFYSGSHSLSIILDHISNAGLGEWNDGLDILGIRFGVRI